MYMEFLKKSQTGQKSDLLEKHKKQISGSELKSNTRT